MHPRRPHNVELEHLLGAGDPSDLTHNAFGHASALMQDLVRANVNKDGPCSTAIEVVEGATVSDILELVSSLQAPWLSGKPPGMAWRCDQLGEASPAARPDGA